MDWQGLIAASKPDMNRLVAGWEPKTIPDLSDVVTPVLKQNSQALVIDNLLSHSECNQLIQLMQSSPVLAPVNYQGNPKQPGENTGSLRVNIWSQELAEKIWKKFSGHIQPVTADDLTLTDWWQGDLSRNCWRPVAISPLLRFMRYEKEGLHLPHYDAGFIYPDDNLRSLLSLIIYLTPHSHGGETRMIDDGQQGPVWQRDHSDWSCKANSNQVLMSCQPVTGRALLFLHRQCHDVAEYHGNESRVIIRTDVIFEAVSVFTHD
jgi:hypothetical protein